MNRRGFLSFLVAAPVTKALPWQSIAKLIAPIAPIAAARIIDLTFSEIVTETIKRHSAQIAANVTANNALLARLTAR